jgi:hypothetical protein
MAYLFVCTSDFLLVHFIVIAPSPGKKTLSLSNMDKEVLLKKMLKCDREYKENMKMGEQMYEFVKEYDIDEKSITKEMKELEF